MHLKKYTMGLLLSCNLLTSRTQPQPQAQTPAGTKDQSQESPADYPKIELHLHLDCSLSYDVVKKLDPTVTPETYRQQFIAPPVCTNLADYINRADKAVALMQTQEALRLVTLDIFTQLQKDHVIYAEIRFAPLKHLQKGLTPEQVVATVDSAVGEGIRTTGIQVGIILCTLRHFTQDQSMETVKLVEKFKESRAIEKGSPVGRKGTHVVGFDIAGDEAGYPIKNNKAAFQYANKHNIPCTAHAGEAAGSKSVWETLNNFHPTRIGHGVRSIEDPTLTRYLRESNILLEVCPTSNLQTNMYPDLAHHPVDSLHKLKVPINISTDCRTISNTTLTKEYQLLETQFHWTKADFLACNLAAVDHAFTTQQIKTRLKAQLLHAYSQK